MQAATWSQALALPDEIVTLGPCSALRSAIALPMPLVEPVMIATLPVRSNSSGRPVFGRSSVVTDIGAAPLNARLSWPTVVDGQASRSSARRPLGRRPAEPLEAAGRRAISHGSIRETAS